MTLSLTAVVVRRGGRGFALLIGGLLALTAVLTLLAPVVGVVHTADGSPVAAASGALWVMVAPAVLVVALAPVRPVAALAAGAGLGLVGVSRLFADLSLLLAPAGVARPELWVETTDHALPVTPAAGVYLLLAGDLVAVAAGVIAAVGLSGRLSLQRDSDFAGSSAPGEVGGSAPGAADGGPGRRGWTFDDDTPVAGEGASVTERFDRMDRTVRRNNAMTVLGLLGALLLTAGALAIPYTGGYLAARYLPPSVGVTGLVGALLLAVVAATAVLVAGILPRSLALALLGGTALAGALPLLIALLAVASTPTHLAATVWVGLGGAVLLTLAALLTRARAAVDPMVDRAAVGADDMTGPVRPPSRALDLAVAGCAILAGGLGIAAFLLPSIDAGGLEDLLFLSDGSPVPAPTAFGAAALPLLLAGLVALVPRIGAAGRAAAAVGWAGLAFAVTGSLEVLGDDGLSAARSMGLIGLGAGAWCGFAALGVGVLAAVLAVIALVRASDSAATVDDDESVGTARSASAPVSVAAGVVAVVASCLPTFATSGQITSPTILSGYAVGTWGVWAMLLVVLGALVAATLAGRPHVVLGLLLGAALVSAVRLVVPAHVSGAAGFGLRPGYLVQAGSVVVLVVAAVLIARNAGRITRLPVDAYGAIFAAGAPPGDSAQARNSATARGSAPPRDNAPARSNAPAPAAAPRRAKDQTKDQTTDQTKVPTKDPAKDRTRRGGTATQHAGRRRRKRS